MAQDCLALGAIFAATDTVAVLQVIRAEEAGVLYSLVFGEGVMNDATSVAILRAVQVNPLTRSRYLCTRREGLYLYGGEVEEDALHVKPACVSFS